MDDPDTQSTPQAARSSIQVIDRSVAMLRAIAQAGPGGLALKSLTASAGLRPSTARTLLSALATHGLVRQRDPERHYLLGPTFFELNRAYVEQTDLASVATPVLRELWEKTDETVHLSVLKDGHRVDLAVLVSRQLLNINPTVARFDTATATVPFHTAAGKVLFAELDDARRDHLLTSAPWRSNVSESKAQLAALVSAVRQQGFATNVEEEAAGVCGVAAPVRDHSGAVVAALCIGYPSVRSTPAHQEAMRSAVLDAADTLSALLGARTDTVQQGEEER
ncbi:IclR family transcriptional regulator [Ruania alba]|uniref:DNA-binding transcriptional regulator, IclR family n=1 Tax=Ruania alba TaxID=648782 RepID=A0A1H5MA74_9MICO|nr:IclR family transcriptional regulator [Ruania alba]SEE86202.1 DNA-binding transcriptional regulator, IclR family [Ruania alba]